MITGPVLVLILLTALLADVVAPFRPDDMDFNRLLDGISASRWLGTDQLGRDTLSRLIHGGSGGHPDPLGAVADAGDTAVAAGQKRIREATH